MRIDRLVFAALLFATACGYRPATFFDAPPVLDARDEQPIAAPRKRGALKEVYWAEAYVERAVTDSLEVARPPLALDVNRLDEVVRSSWFRGHGGADPLDDYAVSGPPQAPFSPTEGEPIDIEPTLGIEDARRLPYQLVLDMPAQPETRTAAMAIASRLVYALGYRVAETHVVTTPSGQRAAAVRLPPGTDLGPTPLLWTRTDDPNDVLRHEDRRTLRATHLLAAWLDMPHFPEHMFRDTYVGAEGRGFVRHYMVGFEGALGTDRLLESVEDSLDPYSDDTGSGWLLLTFGFYPKPDRLPPTSTGMTGVGLFVPNASVEANMVTPPFAPHDRMRVDDAYWLAKRMAALSDTTLAQAVDAGKLSSPKARRYITAALGSRRSDLAKAAFAAVTPCDVAAVSPGPRVQLTLIDHETRFQRRRGPHRYHVEFVDVDDDALAPPRRVRARTARFGFVIPTELFRGRSIVVVRIVKMNGDFPRERSVDVHLMRRGGRVRLFGVEH